MNVTELFLFSGRAGSRRTTIGANPAGFGRDSRVEGRFPGWFVPPRERGRNRDREESHRKRLESSGSEGHTEPRRNSEREEDVRKGGPTRAFRGAFPALSLAAAVGAILACPRGFSVRSKTV